MDSSTVFYLAAFFFILGAAIVAISWALASTFQRRSVKGKTTENVDSGLTEIARLMRDNKTKDLVVGINGQTYKSSNELSPPQQRRLSYSSKVLAKWLEQPTSGDLQVPEEQTSAPEPVEQLTQASPEAVLLESDWIPAETVPLQPQTHTVPPFMDDLTPEVKPVSTRLPDVVGGILKPSATPAPVFKSIAMQINDILQTRISGTPYDARGITVNDAPDHGVVVTLDGQKYQGVKDVPDESVRDIIRSAVMEWEKASKAGSK